MIRKAYLKRVEEILERLDWEIGRLKAKGEKAEEDLRIRYEEEIAILEVKREAATHRMRQVGEAGPASWGHLKGGVQTALDELKQALDIAVARLKKSA